jgi:hypothetical protein
LDELKRANDYYYRVIGMRLRNIETEVQILTEEKSRLVKIHGLKRKAEIELEAKVRTLNSLAFITCSFFIKPHMILKLTFLPYSKSSRQSFQLMTESELSYQRNLLEMLKEKKDRALQMAKDVFGEDVECVVCYVLPTAGNIYSCSVCVNVMCAECTLKLKSCPSCRQNFKKKKYIRNLALEKIVHRLRD